jgi:hypothetical protein
MEKIMQSFTGFSRKQNKSNITILVFNLFARQMKDGIIVPSLSHHLSIAVAFKQLIKEVLN